MAAESTDLAVAAPPPAVVETVKVFLQKNLAHIEGALPRVGLTAESVTRTALSQIYRNPQLEMCDKTSLMRAIIEAASLGLSFALGRAYLVPFNNKRVHPITGAESFRLEATFMPGYQGLVDLVRRSAQVKTVLAGAVYQGDTFVYEFGLTTDEFRHIPVTEPEDSKLTHTYCLIRFLDGGYQLAVLTKAQIDAVRKRSKSGSNGPWVTDYAAMGIKTAVKRCTKLCPASIELSRAIELDNAAEAGERQHLADTYPLPGDLEQLAGDTQPQAAIAAVPVTQTVSQAAAGVLATARAANAAAAGPQPAAAPADAADKVGRGRPPQCPECKVNNLRTNQEREQKKCEACARGAEDDDEGAVDEVPQPVAAPADAAKDPLEELAKRARFHFMKENSGNVSEAELALSGLSGGKVQKFEKLVDYMRSNPEFVLRLSKEIQ